MCGFFGAFFSNSFEDQKLLRESGACIDHRGPDSQGNWSSEDGSIFLHHARLSIFDLSTVASQPMHSSCGRYIIVFNGEIYNFKDLQTYKFVEKKSQTASSDTVVLLKLISEFGVREALLKLDGMFSISVYDRKHNLVTIARDRIGEKPLYYSLQEIGKIKSFAFSSQLKCLETLYKKNRISAEACKLYSSYGYIPEPYSIYENIYKLRPGHLIEFNLENLDSEKEINQVSYWSLVDSYKQHKVLREVNSGRNFSDIVESFTSTFEDTVKLRCAADVDVGSFLSGGIDSTLITAVAKKFLPGEIHTFSVGYEDVKFDEGVFAKSIADYLDTKHHSLIFKPNDAIEMLNEVATVYDEPFSDASQLPTMFLAKYSSNFVKVALSGDGGDELFGGYNRYLFANNFWKNFSKFPLFTRTALSNFIQKNTKITEKLVKILLPKYSNVRDITGKLEKVSKVLLAHDEFEFYNLITSTFDNGYSHFNTSLNEKDKVFFGSAKRSINFLEYMMLMDVLTYLPGDLLVKVDRASMYNGLEVRSPFLSNSIVEFSNSIPTSYKILEGQAKPILKSSLKQYVPSELFDRPKMGFGVPIAHWMRSELRGYFDYLFDKSNMPELPGYDNEKLCDLWRMHLLSQIDAGYQLWNYISLRLWYDTNKNIF